MAIKASASAWVIFIYIGHRENSFRNLTRLEFEIGLENKKQVCNRPAPTAPEIASPARRLLFEGTFFYGSKKFIHHGRLGLSCAVLEDLLPLPSSPLLRAAPGQSPSPRAGPGSGSAVPRCRSPDWYRGTIPVPGGRNL